MQQCMQESAISKIRAHGGCLWLSEAKKDVISCDKLRGLAHTD